MACKGYGQLSRLKPALISQLTSQKHFQTLFNIFNKALNETLFILKDRLFPNVTMTLHPGRGASLRSAG